MPSWPVRLRSCSSGDPHTADVQSPRQHHPKRAIAPLVGIVALVGVTVLLAAVVVGMVAGIPPSSSGPEAGFELAVDAEENRLTITHLAGDPIDVEAVSLTVSVESERLAEQPPVPFFAAPGFESGPTGPFNSRSDGEWTAGERASVAVASTNSPTIETGDQVTVTLALDDRTVGRLEATAS